MITRRTLLAAAAATLVPPAGACDTHTHVFGDPQKYPMSPARGYTPPPASVDQLRALQSALHMDRVIIVQPSVYGTDNSCTLDAVKQLGSRARAVAVIDGSTPLEGMQQSGVRGIRLNLSASHEEDPGAAQRKFSQAIQWIKDQPWHIQVYTQLSTIGALHDSFATSRVPVVFDHFGGAQAAAGVNQFGFNVLLSLVQTGKAYVKISAPYRCSKQAGYSDVAPLAKTLIAANPRRILWGSDWPHPDSSSTPGRKPTDIAPPYKIDDVQVLNLLEEWAPDSAVRKTILVDNPAVLYGF